MFGKVYFFATRAQAILNSVCVCVCVCVRKLFLTSKLQTTKEAPPQINLVFTNKASFLCNTKIIINTIKPQKYTIIFNYQQINHKKLQTTI